MQLVLDDQERARVTSALKLARAMFGADSITTVWDDCHSLTIVVGRAYQRIVVSAKRAETGNVADSVSAYLRELQHALAARVELSDRLVPFEFLEGLPTSWEPLPEGIRTAMRYVSKVASDDVTRPTRNHVLCRPARDGKVVVVATDGHRLAEVTTSGYLGAELLVPAPIAALPEKTAVETAVWNERHAFHVPSLGFTYVSWGDEEFPPYEAVFPSEERLATLFTDSRSARKSLEPFVRAYKARTKAERGSVRLSFANGCLKAEYADTSFTLGCGEMEMSGKLAPIGVNPVYLDEALSLVQGQVTLEFRGPRDPIVVEGRCKAGECRQLIMPVHI